MKKILIFVSIVLLLASSCEKFARHEYSIYVKNKSNKNITIYTDYLLPDTLLPQIEPSLKTIGINDIGSIYGNEIGDPKLEKFETEKLTVFILSTDTVNFYTWSEIVNGYKILNRYEIDHQDLINMGGSIEYH